MFAEYEAPVGQVWVCGACGRTGQNRTTVGDESCFLNAVLCLEEKVAGAWVAVNEEVKG